MSEEFKEVEAGHGNALMDALFNAAEVEEAPPPQAPSHKIRSLAEVMRASAAGETVETPQPEPNSSEAAVEISKRQVELVEPVPQQPIQQPIHQPVQQPVQQPVPQPVPQPAHPDLLPEQVEMLGLARLAGDIYKENPQSAPPEYKDLYQKYSEFYSKESDYVSKAMDTGRDLEYDDEYSRLKERLDPSVSPTLLKSLERESIKRELGKEMRDQRIELARLKHQMHMQTAVPEVKGKNKQYNSENFEHSVPEEYRNEIKEVGAQEFAKRKPFESEVITKTLQQANSLMGQFESIASGVMQYNPAKHGELARELERLGQAHKRTAKSRQGKTFVTRDEFTKLPPHTRAAHFTWEPEEVKQAFKAAAGAKISHGLAEVREKISTYSNGSNEPPRNKAFGVTPTPRTATPRNPTPPTSSEPQKAPGSALSEMLMS